MYIYMYILNPSFLPPPPHTSLKVQLWSHDFRFGHLWPASNFSKVDSLLLQGGGVRMCISVVWLVCSHSWQTFIQEMNLQFPSGGSAYGVIYLGLILTSTTSMTLDKFPHLLWCLMHKNEIKRWATRVKMRVKQGIEYLMLPAHGRQSGNTNARWFFFLFSEHKAHPCLPLMARSGLISSQAETT